MEIQTLFEQTNIAFKQLQTQSISRPKSYPRSLQAQALQLLEHYSAKILSESLGITVKTLQNWRRASRETEVQTTATFVPLTLSEGKPVATSNSLTHMTLKLPHNLELILPEQPLSQMAQLICALVKEFDQCSI